MATGRTTAKFSKMQIEDDSSTMRDIPVSSYGSVGLTYAEQDCSALQDAITSVFNGQGSFGVTITGPFDNSTEVAASGTGARPALSGSHTVLAALNGGITPKSFGVYLGVQGDWATNDPVFGGANTILVSSYTVDPATMTYSAKLVTAGNRGGDPTWGTAAITADT
jgi:hypothetical protein